MRNLIKKIVPATVIIAALGFAPAAHSEEYDANNKIFISPAKAGKSAKIKLDFGHAWTGANPGFPPPGATRLYISLPKGAKVNTKVAEECDTETLEETYGEGCPSDSKLGTGYGVIDASECNMGSLEAKVKVYKTTRQSGKVMNIALVANEPQSGANIIYKAPVVRKSGRYMIKIDDFAVPPVLSCRLVLTRGVFNMNVTKRVKITVKKKGKRRKRRVKLALIQLPKRCKKDKTWTFTSDETFADGRTIVKDIPVKCKK